VIVLDTNVLSEMMKAEPSPRVADWLAAYPRPSFFTTTITRAEILFGVAILPAGRRREELGVAVAGLFDVDLAGHILPFDGAAARVFAEIASSRHAAGHPISQADAQIAAIPRSRDAAVATRNVADFDGCGLSVLNPWGAGRPGG